MRKKITIILIFFLILFLSFQINAKDYNKEKNDLNSDNYIKLYNEDEINIYIHKITLCTFLYAKYNARIKGDVDFKTYPEELDKALNEFSNNSEFIKFVEENKIYQLMKEYNEAAAYVLQYYILKFYKHNTNDISRWDKFFSSLEDDIVLFFDNNIKSRIFNFWVLFYKKYIEYC